MNQPRVVDADGHITEKPAQLAPYLATGVRRTGYGASSKVYPDDAWDRSLGGTLGSSVSDAEGWLRVLDQGSMESVYLYPTAGLALGLIREPERATELARAWNDFTHHEFRSKSPRLRPVAMVAPHEPAEAAKELRRAVKELGAQGVTLPAVGFRLPLGHPSLDPIYAEAERLGCMVAIHATVKDPAFFGAGLFDRFIEVHTLSHPFAQMMHLTSIIFQGVPERFPRLKLGFMEAGCTWVPYWANRMDEEWELRGSVEAPLCKRKPSEYIRGGQIFFPVESGETLVGAAAGFIGIDQLFYASDVPHWDNEYPRSIEDIVSRDDLGESDKRKILADNTERLYRIEPPASAH